ncbi:hypothetical protein GGX14DRAFT_571754 [Mycena pura]|uniref:DUF6534 domain-containing protein n=1 Tax=Mycena pura TaxID=153505 RepID=A0AAD6V2R0_9AGAR|nr:hypothetical protein GGX14DRAFT_571754 [Mycena pura]
MTQRDRDRGRVRMALCSLACANIPAPCLGPQLPAAADASNGIAYTPASHFGCRPTNSHRMHSGGAHWRLIIMKTLGRGVSPAPPSPCRTSALAVMIINMLTPSPPANVNATSSAIQLAPASAAFVADRTTSLGSWVMAAFMDCILMGVVTCQLATFGTAYRAQRHTVHRNRLQRFYLAAAAAVAVLSVLKASQSTVQAIAVVWMQSVYYFADPDAARGLVASAWWQVTMPLMVRLRFPSHRDKRMRGPGVFLHKVCLIRCVRFASVVTVNGTRQVLPPLRQVAVLRPNHVRDVRRSRGRVPLRVQHRHEARAGEGHVAAGESSTPHALGAPALMTYVGQVHLSGVFSADLLITAGTLVSLRRRTLGLPWYAGLLLCSRLMHRVSRMVWESAVPPTVIATTDLILTQVLGPKLLWHLFANAALGKVYAISLLYTVNSVYEIRGQDRMSISVVSGHGRSRSFGASHRRADTADIELSTRTRTRSPTRSPRKSAQLTLYDGAGAPLPPPNTAVNLAHLNSATTKPTLTMGQHLDGAALSDETLQLDVENQ